jgi:hypothetical protein
VSAVSDGTRARGDVGEVLERLACTLREEGGLLAGALRDDRPDDGATLGRLAATGPRSAGREADVAFVIEAIREGYLLHYGTPRIVRDDDRDLALLAGDRLYALGLDRLAALGDVDAVAELADVISLCAQARAAGDPDLAEAVWHAGAVAIGWGADDPLRAAKAAARAARPGAAAELRAAARQIARVTAPRESRGR